ncbi:MAG: methylmalonyl Co-A mutase-associated GTPase MeaB [Chitinophagaceae bacterium]|nr:MAG: methylmalonyl Co-A mutase-associated GTPase MeaB [Chitinophagaceae bacterium]
MWDQLKHSLGNADFKSLARSISLVENEVEGSENFLSELPAGHASIIGITGPPGAGKSTLTDALIGSYVAEGKRVAVLCVDPSSAFNLGALLGDRIRMSDWYNHPQVFIRSLASRGSMGGLHPKIIEVADTVKAAGFDIVIIETVGVGQSEIEVAGLADITVVVLVPEAGDEVQTMKSGLMEIADIFVVNKADRPGAATFVKHLKQMLAPAFQHHAQEIPVIKTVALQKEGIEELKGKIAAANAYVNEDRKAWLLAEKAYQLIRNKKMKDIQKKDLKESIANEKGEFNLYRFVKKFNS